MRFSLLPGLDGLLCKVDLVVDVVVVVPVFLPVDVVTHAEEHGFVLQVGQVFELDGEVESIVPVVDRFPSNVVVEFGHDLGCRLPVVEREACHHCLMESQVSYCNGAEQLLVVRREADFLDSNGQRASVD